MTFRKPWIPLAGAAALLLAAPTMAQQAGEMPAPASSAGNSAVFQTPQGEVTIRTAQPPAATASTPPPFEQLAGKGKAITPEQAAAYPPLANDFDYADKNRDGKVSATEYARWLKGQ